MRSQAPPAGVVSETLTPALLEQFWPVARERLVNALGAHGVADAVAEEAVAEAATRALGRGLVVTDVDDFCRWAFVVARNVAHDSTRRSNRTVLLDKVPDHPDTYDLARHVEARERWRATADAMERLSEADRVALLHELDPRERVGRRESVKQAVRRHRARARLRNVLGQLGGWLGWLRRPTWLWPSLPTASLEGLAALALLPLLAVPAVDMVGPGGRELALPAPATAASVTTGERPPVATHAQPAPASRPTVLVPHNDPAPVDEAAAQGWQFEFTPSPSYDEDHTVFATGGVPCKPGSLDSCSRLYVSRDGGDSWRLLPARGRDIGRVLLPPSYPRDPRIFSASFGALSVSNDGGETFTTVATTTGPATMSPLFSAGDPRIVIGSNRLMPSVVPLQYDAGTGMVTPLALPLPPTAAAMDLWFAGSYADDGRMFVAVLEAPGLPDPGQPRVAFSVPALYTCGPRSCERVIDFGVDTFSPMLTTSPLDPRTVFVGSGYGLFRSTDNGSSFERLELPQAAGRGRPTALVAAPDGRLYVKVGSWGASRLFASDDAGESWALLHDEPAAVGNLAVLPDGTLIEGSPLGRGMGGVRCSADGGRTWSEDCAVSR